MDLLLASGLTVLPLAPVSDVKEEKLAEVLMAISDRLAKEISPEGSGDVVERDPDPDGVALLGREG